MDDLKIEISGHFVKVRKKVVIDDKTTFHRHVISPGDDYSNEDDAVQAACASIHTPEVVALYQTQE